MLSKFLAIGLALILAIASPIALKSGENQYMYPDKEYTMAVDSGQDAVFSGPYRGDIDLVNVDGTEVESSGYTFTKSNGYFNLKISGLAVGVHTIVFGAKTKTDAKHWYSCLVTVGTPSSTTLSNAVVVFLDGKDSPSECIDLKTVSIGTALTSLPDDPVKDGYEFKNWAYFDKSTGRYVNIDKTNLPVVKESALVNGVLKVVPVFSALDVYEIDYYVKNKAFFGLVDKWTKVNTEYVVEGGVIQTNGFFTFGSRFNKFTTDKDGKNELITGTTPKKNMKVYVHFDKSETADYSVRYYIMQNAPASVGKEYYALYKTVEFGKKEGFLDFAAEAPSYIVDDKAQSITYWSADKNGQKVIEQGDEISENMNVYAQYAEEIPEENKLSFVTGIYKEMNSWWNLGNDVLNYLLSTVVLLITTSATTGLIIFVLRIVFDIFSGKKRRYR